MLPSDNVALWLPCLIGHHHGDQASRRGSIDPRAKRAWPLEDYIRYWMEHRIGLRTSANVNTPAFSPDGRWIAYRSDESGTPEIYIRPYPGPGGKWQVSSNGALYPFWSNNNRELFYENLENRIMVMNYTTSGGSFFADKPRLWSDKQLYYPGVANLTLHPDGKRFAVFPMPEAGSAGNSVHVTFLLNFFDELRRRIPAK